MYNSYILCRFASSDEPWDVPEWFLQDERKHRLKPVPVTKEMVEEYKQKWKEINARPIKRVAEAKARKKRRVRKLTCNFIKNNDFQALLNLRIFSISLFFQMMKKMEQAKKKAEAVVNTVDISEKEKMAQLKRYVAPAVQLQIGKCLFTPCSNVMLIVPRCHFHCTYLVSTRRLALGRRRGR